MTKAVLLLSGGLDSTLAGKMLLNQGIEVNAINFTSPFCKCTPSSMVGCSAAQKAAEQLGVNVKVVASGQEYLEIVKHPRFYRGSGMNPCLDCRIFSFKRAGEYMKEIGAAFLITGEVLGERPMSQKRKAMEIIERESGYQGLIVRPLSAQHLEPSEPEKQGLVDRSKFLDIRGRSRKPQMALAEELGLNDYLCPAGGCLLTDKEFAAKLRELLEQNPGFDLNDANLLRFGRHFRLPSGTKAVVGRREAENGPIEGLARDGDLVLAPESVPGPSVLLRGEHAVGDAAIGARLLVSYTKKVDAADVRVAQHGKSASVDAMRDVNPLDEADRKAWLISAATERGAGPSP